MWCFLFSFSFCELWCTKHMIVLSVRLCGGVCVGVGVMWCERVGRYVVSRGSVGVRWSRVLPVWRTTFTISSSGVVGRGSLPSLSSPPHPETPTPPSAARGRRGREGGWTKRDLPSMSDSLSLFLSAPGPWQVVARELWTMVRMNNLHVSRSKCELIAWSCSLPQDKGGRRSRDGRSIHTTPEWCGKI